MADSSRVSITNNVEEEHFRVNSTLVVKNLVLQDTRQYSCRVTNRFGSDTKMFRIIAQRKKLLDMFCYFHPLGSYLPSCRAGRDNFIHGTGLCWVN